MHQSGEIEDRIERGGMEGPEKLHIKMGEKIWDVFFCHFWDKVREKSVIKLPAG